MKLHKGAVLLTQLTGHEKDIPGAVAGQIAGVPAIAFKHELYPTLLARNLGHDVPSPINFGWKYPGLYPPRENQLHTAAFGTLYQRAFILNEMRCVDAETEYLSPTGWRRIDEYNGGQVAQYDKDTGEASFVQPTHYIKKPLAPNETMIRFKTVKGVDQLLTEGHRVLYVSSTGTTQVKSALEIEQANSQASRGWKGRFITTFSLQKDTQLSLSDAEIRLMVAVIADGHFQSETTRCVVRLKKERKIQRLKMLLEECGLIYNLREDQSLTGKGFWVYTFNAPRHDKEYTEYWWGASSEQLKIIVDEVFHWDGSERKAGGSQFSTFIKASADFIQYACSTSGRTASLNIFSRFREERNKEEIEYVVHARENAALLYLAAATSDGQKINNISRERPIDGYCYCFAVPKTFLVMRRNGNVFITGNTGKTYSALWAAEYLLQQGFIKRVLVVCLKTTLHIVWEQAMFECLPHRRCSVLHGTRDKRKDLLEQNAEFCIINHDGLMVFSEEVLRGKTVHVDCTGLKDKFDLIIFDEADVLCNHRTKMYKALKSLLTPDVWLWLMTGTPIPNEYADAWGLLSLVCKKLPVKSWTQFRELVMFRASQYKWLNRDGARQLLFDLMQPAIRFTQAQCFDLPAVQEIFRECELSDEQKKLYRQMQRAGRLERTQEESQVAAANAAVKVAKLLQISSGAVRDKFGAKIQIDSKPRIQALLSILHELGVGNGEKQSAVFMPYKYIMEDVKDALEKKHLRCALVNGDTPDWKRREVLKQFSSDYTGTREYEVLIAHPEVVAHGVDLTASESVIWYAPCFGPRFYQQGNQRHQGAKQKGRPVVVHLTATKLERERFDALRRATQTQSDFLAMYENALSEEI